CLEVRDDRLEVVVREHGRRHLDARLQLVGVLHPLAQVRGRVLDRLGPDRAPRGHVGEVGSRRSGGGRATDHVTARAVAAPEDELAALGEIGDGLLRGLGVRLHPALEVAGRLRDDLEPHVRVLQSAVLGTEAPVRARLLDRDVQVVGLARDHVLLARDLGYPERVDHVGRGQLEVDLRVDRHVDLVRGPDVASGIRHVPPPLTADDLDDQCAAARLTDRVARGHGEDAEDEQDDRRRDHTADPDELVVVEGRAARPPPAAHDGPDDQGRDHDVDRDGEAEHQPPEARHLARLRAFRVQRRRRSAAARRERETERHDEGDAGQAGARHGRLHHAGPTGATKSPRERTNPSASISSGNCGRGAAAGPNTGRPPSSTSNADWWHGHSSWWVDAWYSPTGQPAWVHTFESAMSPSGIQERGPFARRRSRGPTRTSTVWPSAEPACPSGNTVTRPPSGTSWGRMGRPSSLTARFPPRHGVSSSDRPGFGPSDRIGNAAAAAIAAPAPSNAVVSSRRRLTVPIRSRSSSSASRSSWSAASRPKGSRGSTKTSFGNSPWATTASPSPSSPNVTPMSAPSSWGSPPRAYTTVSPTAADAVPKKATVAKRCARVRSWRGARLNGGFPANGPRPRGGRGR